MINLKLYLNINMSLVCHCFGIFEYYYKVCLPCNCWVSFIFSTTLFLKKKKLLARYQHVGSLMGHQVEQETKCSSKSLSLTYVGVFLLLICSFGQECLPSEWMQCKCHNMCMGLLTKRHWVAESRIFFWWIYPIQSLISY